ncbi:MAG: UDP-N-acetylmuramate dehydrogenase [Clostridiales bacterium]|nr:UDP-N-acetylmuramate dehydrogenase [Clostridiales bacterium]
MTENIAISLIEKLIPNDRVLRDEPMSVHTSFRIGGPAKALVLVDNEEELKSVLGTVTDIGAEHILLGNGSNFLVSDEGYPGIMIKLGGNFNHIYIDEEDETLVKVGGAKYLSGTSSFVTDRGLAGMEFASGIPGSIGGALFMNAGAYGGEMKDIVQAVRLIAPNGSRIINRSNEEMHFSYRHSILQEDGYIVLETTLKLDKDDPKAIAERVLELQRKRNSKQPVNLPSAGSTFKRPISGYAAALIDEAGLKGYRIGGAQVSEKHAGFIVNLGDATAEDVLRLMRHVKKVVFEKTEIILEPEVRLINCSL